MTRSMGIREVKVQIGDERRTLRTLSRMAVLHLATYDLGDLVWFPNPLAPGACRFGNPLGHL